MMYRRVKKEKTVAHAVYFSGNLRKACGEYCLLGFNAIVLRGRDVSEKHIASTFSLEE
jgi:carbonic anhydrase/acetyltransferase-like protein (isoleucine patch superfamily)